MNKEQLEKYGLLYRPDIANNDADKIDSSFSEYSVSQTFSENNMKIMKDVITGLGEKCKAVLEIGVAAHSPSSTTLIIDNIPKHCLYLGVDLSEKNLRKVRDERNNIFCLKTNSSNYNQIIEFLHSKGVKELDLIHIDGWHSVNQVLRDWKFTNLLSRHGVVVLHDTNVHPGPVELLKALDQKFWNIAQYFKGRKDDYGIAVVKRKVYEANSTQG